jgi:3-oxoacyl-[acyl-carrier protein] reductase
MTTERGVAGAIDRAVERFRRLDAVVANVGTGKAPTGWDVSREAWLGALEQNLLGSVELARQALGRLARPGGTLTFISSIAGVEATGAPVPYAAAKAGLNAAVGSLARLVGADGIRVNAVTPGNVLFAGGRWAARLADEPEAVSSYIDREVPLRRFGTPEDVADVVVYLASDRAAFVTGASWIVDGGQTHGF